MESKPREIKIWTILQISYLALLILNLVSRLLFPGSAAPPEPPDARYPMGGGGAMVALFLLPVQIVWFMLALALPFGLWTGKRWARTWGIVHSILSLLLGLLWIFPNISIVGIVYVFVSLSNLYLATRPRAKDFFEYCRHAKETAQQGDHVKPDASSGLEEHALLVKYQHKYPHNPEGVLAFHISRKMKEGKTREQAVEELSKENE